MTVVQAEMQQPYPTAYKEKSYGSCIPVRTSERTQFAQNIKQRIFFLTAKAVLMGTR
jgi:hypothetical protein